MFQKLEDYLIEVGLKRLVPAALASGVSALFALAAARSDLLESWGITFGNWPLVWPVGQAPTGHVIVIEMDTLEKAGAAAIFGLVGMLAAWTAHHTASVVDKVTPTAAPPVPAAKP